VKVVLARKPGKKGPPRAVRDGLLFKTCGFTRLRCTENDVSGENNRTGLFLGTRVPDMRKSSLGKDAKTGSMSVDVVTKGTKKGLGGLRDAKQSEISKNPE